MKVEGLEIDEDSCLVDEELINLTRQEHKLLTFLMSHPNRVYTRKRLIKEVWNKDVSETTVDMTMSRIRKKIDIYADYIVTHKGFGFAFKTKLKEHEMKRHKLKALKELEAKSNNNTNNEE